MYALSWDFNQFFNYIRLSDAEKQISQSSTCKQTFSLNIHKDHTFFETTQTCKIPKQKDIQKPYIEEGQLDSTMGKRKLTERRTMVKKTLHRKLKIEQHEPRLKMGENSGAEWWKNGREIRWWLVKKMGENSGADWWKLGLVCLMVFNATFNNISVILW